MKWLLLLILLFSLMGCDDFEDGSYYDGGGGGDGGDADTHEAGDYELYWDDIETFETSNYPDPEPFVHLAQIVILMSLAQGVIWMMGVPVGLGGYECRST